MIKPQQKKLISIVTPCLNEEALIENCLDAIKNLFEGKLKDYRYEHIICDNASTDSSLSILKRRAARDPNIKIIVNSRNFGLFRSMFNGMKRSSGDAVIPLMPVDLQDPPDLIPQFVELWNSGYQVVAGARQTREEPWWLRTCRALFYRFLNRWSDFEIPEKAGEFQLLDRKVVEAVLTYKDKYPYLRALIASVGFKRTVVPYHWKKIRQDKSRFSVFDLFDQALVGISSFSSLPLRACIFVGLVISSLSFLYAFITLIVALFNLSDPPQGIFTLIISLFFMMGIQLTFLGVIGEYILHIHRQVRGGQLVFEEELVNFDKETDDDSDETEEK